MTSCPCNTTYSPYTEPEPLPCEEHPTEVNTCNFEQQVEYTEPEPLPCEEGGLVEEETTCPPQEPVSEWEAPPLLACEEPEPTT